MGVTGLLPLLKSIQRPCHVKSFKGLTLGFDAYCWLHPGTIPCAIELALGKQTTKYVDYVMHRINMLVHYGIKPYVVFDGNYLPSKAGTEAKRAASRAEAKRQGMRLLRMGRTADAHNELQKSIDITPEMARNLMNELQRLDIEYIVAPYEADAQLAYLERKGIIHGILSQDSDLLVFGAKRLITKLDKFGECVEIRRDDFTSCRAASFVGWTDDMFRRMAILTGCDYLPGLKGMGLKTAHGLVRRHKEFDKILRAIQFAGKHPVPDGYAESFRNAESTFLYQWVFCPEQQMLVMSRDWPEDLRPSDISFIGAPLQSSVAVGVAMGNLHPTTKLPLESQSFPKTQIRKKEQQGNAAENVKALSTPSDKGHKKPIDSFFKPRRTPLAELDPNCFTPSPSQQDLLRRGSGSVLSTPVDENNTPTQSFASIASTARSTGALRQSRDRLGLALGANSVPHPSKRQRLSDDSSEKEQEGRGQQVEVVRSKFFGAKAPEPSPSLKRQTRARHTNDSFAIHCDKANQEESLCLPDLNDEASAQQPKLKVFQEAVKKPTPPLFRGESSMSASQSTASSQSASASILSLTSTQATALSLAESQSPEQSQECNEPSAFEEIKSKFTFSASSGDNLSNHAITDTTKVRAFRRESALRRLGRQAIHRSQSLPSFSSAVGSTSSLTQKEQSVEDSRDVTEAESLPRWKTPAEPDALSKVKGGESLLGASQGSEDLIVPNSEEEIPDHEQGSTVSKINFGRFMFKE